VVFNRRVAEDLYRVVEFLPKDTNDHIIVHITDNLTTQIEGTQSCVNNVIKLSYLKQASN